MTETTARGEHARPRVHSSPNQQIPAHNITLSGTSSARCFRKQVPLSNLCPWATSWIWIPSPQSTCLPWRLDSSWLCSTKNPLMYLAILLLLPCACAPGLGPVMGPKAICIMHAEWAWVPSTAQHSTARSWAKLCLHLLAHRAWMDCLLALERQCTQRNSVCCGHSDSFHIVWFGPQMKNQVIVFLLWGLAEAKKKSDILSHLPFFQ
jgi:hypothetical protein